MYKKQMNSLSKMIGFLNAHKKPILLFVLVFTIVSIQSGSLFADGALSLDSFNADEIMGSALSPLQKFAKWTLAIFFNTAVVALVFLFFFIRGIRIISKDTGMWLKGAVNIVVAIVYGAGPFVIDLLSKATPF